MSSSVSSAPDFVGADVGAGVGVGVGAGVGAGGSGRSCERVGFASRLSSAASEKFCCCGTACRRPARLEPEFLAGLVRREDHVFFTPSPSAV
jgi:hypothetical protein